MLNKGGKTEEKGKLISQVTQKTLQLKNEAAAAAAAGTGDADGSAETVQERASKKKKKRANRRTSQVARPLQAWVIFLARRRCPPNELVGPSPCVQIAVQAKVAAEAAAEAQKATYSYTLPCDPGLFGRLRIRCWNEDIAHPSSYSKEAKLPRWQGKKVDSKSQEQKDIEALRSAYFQDLGGVAWRAGPPASTCTWGGGYIPPPPPPSDKEKSKGVISAPVPYDVPELPTDPRCAVSSRLAHIASARGLSITVCVPAAAPA